ncbi:MAG TPA: helix-turn-helix domain-containing protein [Conexibacter sp.]|nr:helix-turn-helix domain-containing protein [Conexibacter sp.]
MAEQPRNRSTSLERLHSELVLRLRSRRPELEATIVARVRATVIDPQRRNDPVLDDDVRTIATAFVDYGIASIEHFSPGMLPPMALSWSARAALDEISLGSVLRCFAVSHASLWDYVIETTAEDAFAGRRTELLRHASIGQGAMLEQLVDAVTREYLRARDGAARSREAKRAEHVQRLLSGRTVHASGLDYELDAQHLGLVATGADAKRALQRLAVRLDARLLSVPRGGAHWGWMGSRGRSIAVADLERHVDELGPIDVSLAVGELAPGLGGFRLTHMQARTAMWVAELSPRRVTRFADVALLACAMRDQALADSLMAIYLGPLGNGKAGASLRQTLRAYFAAGHNASVAAATLGIERRTIANRLRRIEQRLGRTFYTRQAELEVALRLEELRGRPAAGPAAAPNHMT